MYEWAEREQDTVYEEWGKNDSLNTISVQVSECQLNRKQNN